MNYRNKLFMIMDKNGVFVIYVFYILIYCLKFFVILKI